MNSFATTAGMGITSRALTFQKPYNITRVIRNQSLRYYNIKSSSDCNNTKQMNSFATAAGMRITPHALTFQKPLIYVGL